MFFVSLSVYSGMAELNMWRMDNGFDNFWEYRTNDAELLAAVKKFLAFGALTVFDSRRVVSDDVIARYERWLGYWYALRCGRKLDLSEVAEICGYDVDVVKENDSYLIKIRPYLGVPYEQQT